MIHQVDNNGEVIKKYICIGELSMIRERLHKLERELQMTIASVQQLLNQTEG